MHHSTSAGMAALSGSPFVRVWEFVLRIENDNRLREKQNQAGINMRIPLVEGHEARIIMPIDGPALQRTESIQTNGSNVPGPLTTQV